MQSRFNRREILHAAAGLTGGVLVAGCTGRPPATPRAPLPGGLEVRGTRFYRDGRAFFVSGMNHWAAPTLARDGDAPGWDRVRRDFDTLERLGINTVRVMAATEGPPNAIQCIVPSIQPFPGSYEPAGIAGVLRVAEELRRRGLYGIFTLNNFWRWSGGMAQYRAWANDQPIPSVSFEEFVAGFYDDERAKESFRAYVRFLVPKLRANPAVIWEVANEPRGGKHRAAYVQWLDETARLIKSLAPAQLVTSGSEGETDAPGWAGLDVIADHRSPAIDFATCHMWAQNWGWVKPATLERDFAPALERARAYLRRHAALGAQLGKPILVEEFGFPRDEGKFDPAAPTTLRDRYFASIYALVAALCREGRMAGLMPWAWAGESRPPRPGEAFRPGDPLTGDPPHEPQGWYGIYDRDATLAIVGEGSSDLIALARG